MPRAGAKATVLAFLACLAVGCIDPLDTPTAYASQRALCEDAYSAELQAEVEACREERASGGTCGGVLSFAGRLQGQPVTVEDPEV